MRTNHTIKIRVLFALVALAPLVIVVAAFGVATFRAYESSVHDLTDRVALETVERINTHVAAFLEKVNTITAGDAMLIANGYLDSEDQDSLTAFFRHQIPMVPTVSSVYFGNSEGGLAGAGIGTEGRYVTGTAGFAAGTFFKTTVNSFGNPIETVASLPEFDARERTWYRNALRTDGPTWSDPYVLFTGQDMAVAASRQVRASDETLLGVVSVDLFLSQLSRYLAKLDMPETSLSYIVDDTGYLVATSLSHPVFTASREGTPGQRIAVADYPSELVTATVSADGTAMNADRVKIDGTWYVVASRPIHGGSIPAWHTTVVIPESYYLSDVVRTFQVAVLSIILVTVAVFAVVLWLSWVVTRPLIALVSELDRFTGEERPMMPRRTTIREIAQLIGSFKAMSDQLYDTLQRLNVEVRERKAALDEREVLIRELNHRTKNNMNVISAMLRLRAATVKNDEVIAVFQELDHRITSMALAHQKLYQSKRLSQIDIGDYLTDLIGRIGTGVGFDAQAVNVSTEVDHRPVPIDVAVPIGIVLNELLTNIAKHAFAAEPVQVEAEESPNVVAKDEPRVSISFRVTDDNTAILIVADNGSGFPPEVTVDPPKTLGLQTISMIVEHQLQGRVSFQNERGLVCRCTFSLPTVDL